MVYKARQGRLGRLVALKVLHEEAAADPQLVERFLTEAEAAARLGKHPNIVYVLYVGEWNGCPCVVMDYAEGGTLAAYLGRKAQPPCWSAQLIATLARAIHYAHERGLVHRDLKSSNIVLTGDGTPKIIDWGIAKLLDQDRTQVGMILGTDPYMAPEQRNGQSHEADARTDVWALGVILYEALTGRPPSWRLSEKGTLVPVSGLAATIPADLELICRQCLAYDPRERFPTAAALADSLEEFLQRQEAA
jgi:serine/threonine-protein kinase